MVDKKYLEKEYEKDGEGCEERKSANHKKYELMIANYFKLNYIKNRYNVEKKDTDKIKKIRIY